jgi:hypothetical protein
MSNDAHAHDHNHDQDHGHKHGGAAYDYGVAMHGQAPGGHNHADRGGPLGWLLNTFAHSHNVHAQIDDALETNELGIRALKLSLLGLSLTAIFQVVIVLFSGSTALLADTIHNFGDATTSLPLWLAFALQRRGRNRSFT